MNDKEQRQEMTQRMHASGLVEAMAASFRQRHTALVKAWERAERCPCRVDGCDPTGVRECEKGIRERRELP